MIRGVLQKIEQICGNPGCRFCSGNPDRKMLLRCRGHVEIEGVPGEITSVDVNPGLEIPWRGSRLVQHILKGLEQVLQVGAEETVAQIAVPRHIRVPVPEMVPAVFC